MSEEKTTQDRCGYCAIIGRPNVGKSTLVNQLMQRKLTITSKRPQTTRHSITCILTDTEAQMQLILVDTPGINFDQKQHITKWMHDQAMQALKHLDVRIWLLEAGKMTAQDIEIGEKVKYYPESTIVILNKIDELKDKTQLLKQMQRLSELGLTRIIPISAIKQTNFSGLFKELKLILPQQDYIYPEEQQVTISNEFMSSEVIREKLLRYLGEEIPYECSVKIDQILIRGDGLHTIRATIYCGAERHKKVIVGAQGEKIKMIGQAARLTLEGIFQEKVYLELWVKVKEAWAAHQEVCHELGLVNGG